MSCTGRAAAPAPVNRVWRGGGLSARLGRRRATGKPSSTYVPVNRGPEGPSGSEAGDDTDAGVLGRLRKEVRACEYRDVHVMWEMLSSGSNAAAGATAGSGGAVPGVAAGGKATARRGKKPVAVAWCRLLTYCCAL